MYSTHVYKLVAAAWTKEIIHQEKEANYFRIFYWTLRTTLVIKDLRMLCFLTAVQYLKMNHNMWG
jgi:hypothetical protein